MRDPIFITALGAGWSQANFGYKMTSGTVQFVGEVWGGTVGIPAVFHALPLGFRPSSRVAAFVPDLNIGTSDGVLNIQTNGDMAIVRDNGGPGSPGLALGSVSFIPA